MKVLSKGLRMVALIAVLLILIPAHAMAQRTVTDARGRTLTLPDTVSRIICSGPGCLRLVTYLGGLDRVVAVDDIEGRQSQFDARPYALANPALAALPVFGGFRGHDDPEKILGLAALPQVIFKTFPTMGQDPVELQAKTDIPVVILDYGDLGRRREQFYTALEIMGNALGLSSRADEVISFFKGQIKTLNDMTAAVTDKKRCFVGGIAYKGPHGFQSTEPFYPPFGFINVTNVGAMGLAKDSALQHTIFSKETLLTADPDLLFLDLSTLQMGDDQGGLFELKHDPAIQALSAAEKGDVFGLLPYNWYAGNFGSILADAWYIGTVVYPDAFADVDPAQKADEIYQFLIGAPMFERMNRMFGHLAFTRIKLQD